MDVLARVRATVQAHDLLPAGSSVVVAVSGGPDSLCLLHVLGRLREELELRLHVAHLNHGLRPEAEAEAAFVATTAQAWGLPFTIGAADVPALARRQHLSLEEAARVARYRFLAGVAATQGAGAVATGHNADDQVETVLMHCLRGSGLAGLRGMRRRASWPESAEGACPLPVLVRPLLDVPRAAVEAYCHEHNIEPRLDRSNLELTYFRNRIRHELIPALETYNPRIRELLRHTADGLADDYDYLQSVVEGLWPRLVLAEAPAGIALAASEFRALAPSLQRAAIRRAVHRLRRSLRDLSWVHVERSRRAALSGRVGAVITLPAGLVLEVSYDRLVVRQSALPYVEPRGPSMEGPERPLQVPGATALAPDGWTIEAHLSGQCPPAPVGEDRRLQLCLDAQRTGVRLYLRTRRPGDRFQPRGLGGHSKSVKDYMIDARVPRGQRDRVPLLVSEHGILWIVGWRAAELAAPTPATERFLCLRLVPPRGGPA